MTFPTAQAVIGAGHGDEGKGALVDALAAAAPARPVVVRYNGGAQAGHTVTRPDGDRHVFHHIGAGSLAGAATHLSRFFVHHPMLLMGECDAVAAIGGSVAITADPRGLVTTPWDMLINQAVEHARDNTRHGSCGLGFGETIERNLTLPLSVADLTAPNLKARLQAIRDSWAPARLQALGVLLQPDDARLMADDALLDVFLQDCAAFLDHVALAPDANLGDGRSVIFEGAQGLQLDQAIGVFPHVTRSHTGLVNIAAIAREAGLAGVSATYVHRAYQTRHGAGPLDGAGDLTAFEIADPTNAPNPWQGAIRYAPLDLDRIATALDADRKLADPGPVRIDTAIAITCLDQARAPIPVTLDGTQRHVPAADLAALAARRLDRPLMAQGWGATRATVDLAPIAAGARP